MLPEHKALRRERAKPHTGMEQEIAVLATIRMSEKDRRMAEDYLRKGELIAELVLGAIETVRSAAELVRGFFNAPAHARRVR